MEWHQVEVMLENKFYARHVKYSNLQNSNFTSSPGITKSCNRKPLPGLSFANSRHPYHTFSIALLNSIWNVLVYNDSAVSLWRSSTNIIDLTITNFSPDKYFFPGKIKYFIVHNNRPKKKHTWGNFYDPSMIMCNLPSLEKGLEHFLMPGLLVKFEICKFEYLTNWVITRTIWSCAAPCLLSINIHASNSYKGKGNHLRIIHLLWLSKDTHQQ